MGWGTAHGFLGQNEIYSLLEKRAKKACLMLEYHPPKFAFRSSAAVLNQLFWHFPGKDAFHYTNALQAVLGPGAGHLCPQTSLLSESPYHITWEQQRQKQWASAHGWQKRKHVRFLSRRWSQTSSLCGKTTLPQSWAGSGEHIPNTQVGQPAPAGSSTQDGLGAWHTHSLCHCNYPQSQTLLMEEKCQSHCLLGPPLSHWCFTVST